MIDRECNDQPVLLTGMGGVLGAGLAAGGLAKRFGSCVVAGRRAPAAWTGHSFLRLDLVETGALQRVVDELQPRAVLHAAALARLDQCEEDPELADRVNHQAAVELGEACARLDIPWVYFSTDQVFDGRQDRYDEQCAPSPLHQYGVTKARGEDAALQARGSVVRLPLLLGPPVVGTSKQGADAAVIRAAVAAECWTLFDDEWRVPVDPALLVTALAALCEGRPSGNVFHLVGSEAVSRAELGQRACAAAEVAFSHRVGSGAGFPGPPRPPRLILTTEQSSRELGFTAPDLRQSLARTVAALRPDPDSEFEDDV